MAFKKTPWVLYNNKEEEAGQGKLFNTEEKENLRTVKQLAEQFNVGEFKVYLILKELYDKHRIERYKCKGSSKYLYEVSQDTLDIITQRLSKSDNKGTENKKSVNKKVLKNKKRNGNRSIIGKTFGKLKVIKRVSTIYTKSGRRREIYLCHCSCGNMIEVTRGNLLSGRITSCGCEQAKSKKKVFTLHFFNWEITFSH